MDEHASRTLDDQVGTEDSHAADTDTSLSGTIGSAKAGENDGRSAAQRTEEGLKANISTYSLISNRMARPGVEGWPQAQDHGG